MTDVTSAMVLNVFITLFLVVGRMSGETKTVVQNVTACLFCTKVFDEHNDTFLRLYPDSVQVRSNEDPISAALRVAVEQYFNKGPSELQQDSAERSEDDGCLHACLECAVNNLFRRPDERACN
jgi:hypothetical protein